MANHISEPSVKLKTVDDSGSLIDLNENQLKVYEDFMTAMNSSLSHDTDDCVVYRGEKLSRIAERMHTTKQFDQVLYKLFMWGEKAKHYYSGRTDFFKSIEDLSKVGSEQIFDGIKAILMGDIPDTYSVVSEFKKNNSDFCNYFKDIGNKEKFIENISKNQQLKLYYFYFLHTFGDDFLKNSVFVSTSRNKGVASYFARFEIEDADSPIIFCYYNKKNKSIDSTTVFKGIDQILPLYNGIPLHEEEEKSVIAALFPQYIFCIELPKQNETVVNPWLFKQDEAKIENDIFTKFKNNGLYIDQKDIDIMSIGYNFMVRDDNGKYQNC